MRSVWKGTIGYGPVAIPVKAYGATEEHGTGLNQLHATDGGRIRIRRFCEVDDAEVPYAEIAKGATGDGGEVVILTEEDLATLPLPTADSIEVSAFVPLEQVDPIYYAKSYYLEPEPAGTKPYVLLAEALRQSGKVAVVKVALRQRETLAVLRVKDQVLVLGTMLWPDEIRTPDFPFLAEDVDVRTREVRTATKLIDQLATDFVPERFTDRYQEALDALITAKAEGREVVVPTAVEQDEGVARLLAALQADEVGRAAVSRARSAAKKAGAAKESASRAAAKASTAPRKRPAAKR